MNMATAQKINIGEAVGIIAAQSIGEPGTKPFPVVGQSLHIDFHSRTHDAREYEGCFHPSAAPNSGYGHESRNAHLRFP